MIIYLEYILSQDRFFDAKRNVFIAESKVSLNLINSIRTKLLEYASWFFLISTLFLLFQYANIVD